MKKNEHSFSRRSFILLLTNMLIYASGILGGYILLRFFSHQSSRPSSKKIIISDGSSSSSETEKALEESGLAIIYQNGNPAFGLSLKCTHLGCFVRKGESEWVCPCHGSRYSLTGQVIRGPATAPLRQLPIQKDEQGKLYVLIDE